MTDQAHDNLAELVDGTSADLAAVFQAHGIVFPGTASLEQFVRDLIHGTPEEQAFFAWVAVRIGSPQTGLDPAVVPELRRRVEAWSARPKSG